MLYEYVTLRAVGCKRLAETTSNMFKGKLKVKWTQFKEGALVTLSVVKERNLIA